MAATRGHAAPRVGHGRVCRARVRAPPLPRHNRHRGVHRARSLGGDHRLGPQPNLQHRTAEASLTARLQARASAAPTLRDERAAGDGVPVHSHHARHLRLPRVHLEAGDWPLLGGRAERGGHHRAEHPLSQRRAAAQRVGEPQAFVFLHGSAGLQNVYLPIHQLLLLALLHRICEAVRSFVIVPGTAGVQGGVAHRRGHLSRRDVLR
mmetsp:Transcript_741/g.2025  ORF Transcript_741/g.2025 Transcript_741/m.2025 type:complete len:207 (-) Transcript_741:1328-1948(-)